MDLGLIEVPFFNFIYWDYTLTKTNSNRYLCNLLHCASKKNVFFQLFVNLKKQIDSMKIALLDKGMVGKSSLTYKYINYKTPKDHDPTIEDKYSTVVTVGEVSCEVEILDTAGQEEY